MTASLAASRMSSGPTVPNSGPHGHRYDPAVPVLGVLAGGLDVYARARVESAELEALGALGVLHTGATQVVEDAGHELARVGRRGRRLSGLVLGPVA